MYQKFYTDHNDFKTHVIGTEFKFVLFPKICHISKKILWLKYVYKQTAMWTGPDDPVFEYRYYDKAEFLVNRLKGVV